MTDFYAILGVRPDATQAEITQRYRFLAKAYHPDRFGDPESKAQAEEEMKRVNEAYAVLSKPDKRQAYDRETGRTNSKNTGQDTQAQTERYVKGLTEYFEYLHKKWWGLVSKYPESPKISNTMESIFKGIRLLIFATGHNVNSLQGKQITEEIKDSLAILIQMNTVLGVELVIQGLPKEFSLMELKVFTSLLFYDKLIGLSNQANQRGSVTSEKIEQAQNGLIELSLVLCDQCLDFGRSLVKDAPTRETRAAPKPSQTTQPKPPPPNNTVPGIFCQSCLQTPAENLTFRQNIGVLIFRWTQTVTGPLCASCAERYFWRMTGITFLFGWWGVISMITTPFILIANIVNYSRASKLRQHSHVPNGIGSGWKTAAIVVAILVIYFTLSIFSAIQNSQAHQPEPTQSKSSSIAARPTQRPKPTPTRTKIRPTATPRIDCEKWSTIRASDKGKYLCVYGTVQDAYFGGENFFMRFSEDSDAFRFLVSGGYYEGVIGECVSAFGKVETLNQMPYIVVKDELYNCPWLE